MESTEAKPLNNQSKIGDVFMQYLNLSSSPAGYENRNRFSLRQKALTKDDEEFLRIVKAGDHQELVYYLQTHPKVNFNSCDCRGLRALEIAVLEHDEDMTDSLLSMGTFSEAHLQGAAIHAVMENEQVNLKVILDAYEKAQEERKTPTEDETDSMLPSLTFRNECSPGWTPIMAAAASGNLEITQMLLARGNYVPKPHPPKCKCDKCYGLGVDMESLTESMARINAYKALSNPVYMALTSDDPILTAFELSMELDILAYELPEHKSVYKELEKQCSKFAADLLNECCDTREVQIVLSQRKGFPDPRPRQFSRLHLAVHYEQKEFVTHPSCQQVLRSMWVEGLSWWRWSTTHRLSHVVQHVLLFPFLSLAYIALPIPFVLKQVKVPLNRFIHCAASYMVFLALILATLLTGKSNGPNSPSLGIDVAVGIYVYSYFWEIMVSMYLLGVRTSLRSWWAVYDLFQFSLFLASELLWLSAFIINTEQGGFFSMSRNEWPWYHPYLIGEGIYAIASILAFLKLMIWYQMSARLGPLSTSLRYMVGDVFRFLLIITIIIFAFATGINSLYKNYEGNVKYTIDGEEIVQPSEFVRLRVTGKTLFWGIFGLGESESADLVVAGNDTANYSVPEHIYTEFLGYSLWGVYHLLTVIILVNMLVAMMTDSFQRVQNNSDMEWKFARGSLWLAFMDSHTTVSPPFNLIPTAWGFRTTIACLKSVLRNKPKSTRIHRALQECCFWDTDLQRANDKLQEESYQRLMVHLIHRYLQKKNRRDSSSPYFPQEIIEKLKMDLLIDFRRTLRKNKTRKNLIVE